MITLLHLVSFKNCADDSVPFRFVKGDRRIECIRG